mgnify:CR=1 FL=1
MAITVNWDEKCGEATFEEHFKGEETRTYTLDLYVGNCFLVMIHEFINEDGEKERQLCSFFVDEGHMKRCLDDGIFTRDYSRLSKIRINKAKCRYYREIVAILTEAFDDLEIEIFTEGEKTWREYKEPQPTIPDVRMREIAEEAMSFLHDNDMIEEFLDDRGFDLDGKEKYYFGISFDDEEI